MGSTLHNQFRNKTHIFQSRYSWLLMPFNSVCPSIVIIYDEGNCFKHSYVPSQGEACDQKNISFFLLHLCQFMMTLMVFYCLAFHYQCLLKTLLQWNVPNISCCLVLILPALQLFKEIYNRKPWWLLHDTSQIVFMVVYFKILLKDTIIDYWYYISQYSVFPTNL